MFFDTRPKVTVHIATSNETFPCALDESLLKGMMRLGRRHPRRLCERRLRCL